MPPKGPSRTIPGSVGSPTTAYQHEPKGPTKTERKYIRFAAVGTQFGLAITLFTLGGVWLDGKFEQLSPLFTLLGFFVGFAGGTASLIYHVLGSSESKNKQ